MLSLVAALFALLLPAPSAAADVSVRITSPLGRTGTPGTVRIVAQVKPAIGQTIAEVRFSVDGKPQGTVTNGPPYSVEWTDANPFERRTIVAEAQDTSGDVGRDEVVLEPYELNETTEVTSVLVEAAIYDAQGPAGEGHEGARFRPRGRWQAAEAGHGGAGGDPDDVRGAGGQQPEHVA